jgi:hypothetical protein
MRLILFFYKKHTITQNHYFCFQFKSKKKMNIRYTIDKEKGIVYEVWSKNVSFNDYRTYKSLLFEDPEFDPDFDVICDMRNYTSGFKLDEVDSIIQLFLENPSKTHKRKSALVTNDPMQVAGSMIFQTKSEVLPIQVLVFSTLEAAIDWVKGNVESKVDE